ncbi:MAG: M48 family metalloprotease [Acidobacteria bacterium]|nr:M48 family metalloprotease [Acidobacteriota bacterium]
MNRRLLGLLLIVVAMLVLIVFLSRQRLQDGKATAQPFVDRATEVVQAADRLGLELTPMTLSEELALGAELHRASFAGRLDPNEEDQAYLRAVMETLQEGAELRRSGFSYQIFLLDLPYVNAFALPGGYVYVTRGLLAEAESEAELASVIGHEMAHVDLGHCVERVQYQEWVRKRAGRDASSLVAGLYQFLSIGYSDEQEEDADQAGMAFAFQTGYQPQAAWDFHARLGDEESSHVVRDVGGELDRLVSDVLEDYWSTHPNHEQRIQNLQKALRALGIQDAKAGYVGRRNLRERRAKSQVSYPEELRSGG